MARWFVLGLLAPGLLLAGAAAAEKGGGKGGHAAGAAHGGKHAGAGHKAPPAAKHAAKAAPAAKHKAVAGPPRRWVLTYRDRPGAAEKRLPFASREEAEQWLKAHKKANPQAGGSLGEPPPEKAPPKK